jgi:hypothetical protein
MTQSIGGPNTNKFREPGGVRTFLCVPFDSDDSLGGECVDEIGGGPATGLNWDSLRRGSLWNIEESFGDYPEPLGQDWFLDLLGDGAPADGYIERRATPHQ